MRIVFMGTPDYGVPSLEALLRAGHEVVGVFTQPDKPSGRGKKTQFSPVKACALAHGIPVFQPLKIRVDGVEPLRRLQPDLCVTAAFGQILSQEVLDIPRLGTVNVHASLLPAYRGSSPVVWCLLNGEKRTGVTTMLTDKGIDTGDILLQEGVDILPEDNAGTLTDKLAHVGAQLLVETLRRMEAGDCPRQKQDESKMSYYPMLKKEMGRLDFTRSTTQLLCQMRAFDPWPCAVFTVGGETFKAFRGAPAAGREGAAPGTILTADGKTGLVIATGDGAVRIDEMQAPGGKRMRAADYLRGHQLTGDQAE